MGASAVRWRHGYDDWKWYPSLSCWVHKGTTPGNYYCRGDRMFHQAYGRDRHHISWHGSYTENWHGGIQTDSFALALAWLMEANGDGHSLW